MTHYEMAEKLSEKMGVSLEKATAALEACDWEMLDAALMLETGTPAIKKVSSMSRIANIKNNNQMDLQENRQRDCYTELAVEGGNGLPRNGDLKGDQHHEKK